MTNEAILALIALRDCTVVRARWDHPAYRELRQARLCTMQWAAGNDWDFRLTERGRQLAATAKGD